MLTDRANALTDRTSCCQTDILTEKLIGQWSDNILCNNPINLVSESEQDNYNILAAGCALAEI